MNIYYLVNIMQHMKPEYREQFKEGKTIVFEMPSFCSGDYTAKIYKDELGLYINSDHNFFDGCRDFSIE